MKHALTKVPDHLTASNQYIQMNDVTTRKRQISY